MPKRSRQRAPGAGRKPQPRTIHLAPVPAERSEPSRFVLLHPKEVAERLGASPARILEWITEGALPTRPLFGTHYTTEEELARAVLAGFRRYSSPPPANPDDPLPKPTRPTPPASAPAPRARPGSVAPDFSETVPAAYPVPYTDGRRLPPLPKNWRAVVASAVPEHDAGRVVRVVEGLWLEGLKPPQLEREFGVSEGTIRRLKKTALSAFGI